MGYAPHMMPQVGEIHPACGLLGVRRPRGCQTAAGADAVVAGITGEGRPLEAVRALGTRWAGGALGRIATQLVYWRLQAGDWLDESDRRTRRRSGTLSTSADLQRATIGPAPPRDARLITGAGTYLDDLRFERLAHAVVLRSPHAHAWIHGVHIDAARRAPACSRS